MSDKLNRIDKELAFMLQFENIAWYDDGCVKILDRRVYPNKVHFVECKTHKEVSKAIADMVTQSAGPYLAVAMGMALAGYESKHLEGNDRIDFLTHACNTLANSRPTTSARMMSITKSCLEAGTEAIKSGKDPIEAMFNRGIELSTKRYSKIKKIAENLVSMFPDKGTILTQCFGESVVGFMIQEFQKKNKDIKVVCAETRPYFQGARLTATVAYDQGADVTVITDNMVAYTMQEKKIDVFTSAADLICLNGAVVNKIGTFQIAIVAKYLGIPYFVTGAPDKGYHGFDDIHFEFRDEKLVTEAMGVKTSKEGVKGFYPAFDYTPPHLVSAVVTDLGIYSPYDVFKYYIGNDEGEY
ncbi:S-methyl-5-thioribose-1-phosphate isomerase [Brachyspira sp. G79]|uniref:S-methyl-5-thioribose-1-phosphate isomerase n=1 Tax=Brachyspira sp. G79 TaxID=1358104 RepID=UPI000BBC0306|nr:S-methyl-5-thioribose-1-phosphate isomerase [Brachyspira sp. G79]PCG20866.1 methylthioribose-1-phosphate isomerase [Brachyspira sp. G79]